MELNELLVRWGTDEPAARVLARTSVAANGCWECSYAKDTSGYSQVSVKSKMLLTHRVVYEAVNGPIAAGLQIDHLCRNRACCNPSHLEAVTPRENVMRGQTIPARNAAATHCPQGHARTPENTFPSDSKPGRQKRCRTCHIERVRAHKARQRSAA